MQEFPPFGNTLLPKIFVVKAEKGSMDVDVFDKVVSLATNPVISTARPFSDYWGTQELCIPGIELYFDQ